MCRPDACFTFVPVFVPMASPWHMEDHGLMQGLSCAPGDWGMLGASYPAPQQQQSKTLSFSSHQGQHRQKNDRKLQVKKVATVSKDSSSVDDDASNPDHTKTTLIFRNCPTEYGRDALIKVLDAEGFAGLYDFVHLPVEFSSAKVLGYAVINMISHSAALRAMEYFQGFDKWASSTATPCEVAWNNPLQGLAAHIDRYRNSPLMHHSVPEHYRPVLY